MRKLTLGGLMSVLTLVSVSASAQKTDNSANKFVLDYNVPESPAFTILGVSPASVVRGTASKPVVASLLSQIGNGGKLLGGAALDVAPYGYFGRFTNVREYQTNALKRILANVLLSFASAPLDEDTASLRFGAGVRVTLTDPRDLLQDSSLTRDISRRLVPNSVAGGSGSNIPGASISTGNIPPSEVTTGDTVDLSDAYKAARERIKSKTGLAASVGFGYGGTLRGSVASNDSIKGRIWRSWFAGTYYLGETNEVLGTVQWAKDSLKRNEINLGLAWRLHADRSSVAAELVFDGKTQRLLPGLNAELPLVDRISALISLVNEVAPGADKGRLRFKTSFKWAAAQGY